MSVLLEKGVVFSTFIISKNSVGPVLLNSNRTKKNIIFYVIVLAENFDFAYFILKSYVRHGLFCVIEEALNQIDFCSFQETCSLCNKANQISEAQ